MEGQPTGGRRRRRHHSDEFKAEAVAAASQPGVSMAAIALSRGINANLLRRWMREAEAGPDATISRAGSPPPVSSPGTRSSAFVPLQLPAPTPVPGDIRLEIRRGATTVVMTWPAGLALECGAWLRELLR
jgi:transposase